MSKRKLPEKLDIEAIAEFINELDPDTKVYVGCDSERFKLNGQWMADYMTVVVVHYAGRKGCKLFGAVSRAIDYDSNKKRPSLRLMTEVYKVAETYLALAPLIANDMEIHIDVNPDYKHGSYIIHDQAVGYIKGVCGITPKVKDQAFAASYASDRLKEVYALPYWKPKEKETDKAKH